MMVTACAAGFAASLPPERSTELPEVIVFPEKRPVLHMLGYIREYSTLTTLTDTVFLFREKMVDFMIPSRKAGKFKGWTRPRLLGSRSYYRFANSRGLDSVSDNFSAHFSWSDWMELPVTLSMRPGLMRTDAVSDTLRGRYSVSQIWARNGDEVSVNVDVLADTLNRSWTKGLAAYYLDRVDFDKISISCDFEDVDGGDLPPDRLEALRLHIKSAGRGYDLSRSFRGLGQPYVETKAELYFTDKQYITLKEAKRLAKHAPLIAAADIEAPSTLADPGSAVCRLMARVDGIDRDRIRMEKVPDQRLAGIKDLFKTRRNTWQQFWDMISPPRYSINATTYPR